MTGKRDQYFGAAMVNDSNSDCCAIGHDALVCRLLP